MNLSDIVRFTVIASICCLFASCSAQRSVQAPEALLELTRADTTEVLADAEDAPLDVEVAQAFIRNQRLEVMVRLTPKIDLESADVAVAVVGLFEGEVREEQVQGLAEAVNTTTLEAGESIALRFSLQAQDLSEYQVKASWGREAEALLASVQAIEFQEDDLLMQDQRAALKFEEPQSEEDTAPVIVPPVEPKMDQQKEQEDRHKPQKPAKPTLPGLFVEIVKVERNQLDCDESPCDNLLNVNACLQNNSDSPVSKISLGMGLFWVNSGDAAELPKYGTDPLDTEEVINLFGVSIAPGEKRKIRVRVDRPVPIVPGGEFIPHLRLLSYLEQEQSAD